jgi:hypothetical protein
LPVLSGTAPGSSSSPIRSTPIVPSREICAALALEPIPSRPRDCATRRSIRARTAGVPAPAGDCQTTSTVSGLCCGKRALSSSAAARDSEPGVE